MRYEVSVTWDHIRRGVRGDVQRCPTGLALEEAGAAGVYFPMEALPPVAQRFIRDFDVGRAVEPFRFVVHDNKPEPQRAGVGGGRSALFEPVTRGATQPYVNPAGRAQRFEPRTTLVPYRQFNRW